MPKLKNLTSDSPLKFKIKLAQEGWISSAFPLGALVGGPLTGPLSNKLGRKRVLLISALIYAAAYFLFLIASTVWHIYVGRFLQGIAAGMVCTVMPMYIGEITTDEFRGPIGCLMSVFYLSGIIYVYTLGAFLTYLKLQFGCLAVPIIFLGVFFFMPETPYFYAMKRRKSAAVKSLAFLCCRCTKDIEEEISQIQSRVDSDMSHKGTWSEILRNRPYRRAFFICFGLMSFLILSGTDVVTFNNESIFASANSPLKPAYGAIIVGAVQLAANLVTPFIVNRIGRKIILMASSLGMCIALIVLGLFFYIQAFGDASAIRWVPIPALMMFSATLFIGYGPLSWWMLSEVLPANIKATVSSFSITFSFVITFVLVRFFPAVNAYGEYYSFWLLAGFNALSFIFVLFVVIETKGLSLQEIQDKLANPLKIVSSNRNAVNMLEEEESQKAIENRIAESRRSNRNVLERFQ